MTEFHWVVIMALGSVLLVGFFSSIKKKPSFIWESVRSELEEIIGREEFLLWKLVRLVFLYFTIKRNRLGKVDIVCVGIVASTLIPGCWDVVLLGAHRLGW